MVINSGYLQRLVLFLIMSREDCLPSSIPFIWHHVMFCVLYPHQALVMMLSGEL